MSVRESILAHLTARGAAHRVLEHEATYTSAEAAAARGLPESTGGKALVMKLYGVGFVVLGLSAARRADNRALRRFFGTQRLRFARRPELLELTGLAPGCVPPLGRPIFDLPLYVDAGLAAQPELAFTPGVHTASVIMSVEDYLDAAQPEAVFAFARG